MTERISQPSYPASFPTQVYQEGSAPLFVNTSTQTFDGQQRPLEGGCLYDKNRKKVRPLTKEEVDALKYLKPMCFASGQLMGRIICGVGVLKEWAKQEKRKKVAALIPQSSKPCPIIFITENGFHVVRSLAGEGKYSTAYHTRAFPIGLCSNMDHANDQLVKFSNKSFDSQAEMLRCLSPSSQRSSNIDHISRTYPLISNEKSEGLKIKGHIAIFNPSTSDLNHIDYKDFTVKIDSVVKQLIDMVDGISSFHRKDMVLRDIKGANLLYNHNRGCGKVTDFGFLKKVESNEKKHPTALTPKYAAPYIWNSILDQRYNKGGFQGKAADVFAFGRTLQLDVINLILRQYGEKQGVLIDHDLLVPKTITGKYSDNELLKFESTYPGRVFCVNIDNIGNTILLFFEEPIKVCENTLFAIKQLKAFLSKKEFLTLKLLALLAKNLQSTRKDNLLRFLEQSSENKSDALIQSVHNYLSHIYSLERCRPEIRRPREEKRPSNSIVNQDQEKNKVARTA